MTSGDVVDLERTGQGALKQALQLIAMTPSGVRLLERLLPRLQNGLRILPKEKSPEKFLSKMAGTYVPPDQDNPGGTVYVDLKEPIGVLLPTLFHEMTHATDDLFHASLHKYEDHIAACEAKGSRENCLLQHDKRREMAKAEFATERRAYTEEWRFVQEMAKINPCYVSYLRSHGPDSEAALYYVPDEAIKDVYGD